MNTKFDPLGETLVVNISAFDPHAAQTVIQSVDFHAETRDLAILDVSVRDTGIATIFWVARPTIQDTDVAIPRTEVVAAPVIVPPAFVVPPVARPRRALLAVAGLLAAWLVAGVIRVLLGQESARATVTQTAVPKSAVVAPPVSQPQARPTTQATPFATPHLTPQQVQALETEAVRALFAADEATAMASYRALAVDGHHAAQRVVLLLERAP